MISLDVNLISDYKNFVINSLDTLLPVLGLTAGIFLAFTIFEKVARVIQKSSKKN